MTFVWIGQVSGLTAHNCLLTLNQLTEKYAEVFQPELDTFKKFQAHLHLKEGARPIFLRPRSVLFALKESLERELERLEQNGTLCRAECSEWASPIVPVPKKDGTLRICGDYKVSLNGALQVDQYLLPRPSDLFTMLDLSAAYQQLSLDAESRKLVTINTHKGLFQFTRLSFGVASAPAVFQRTMDTVLQGIPQVICYIDDILVTGKTEAEHLSNLEVLKNMLEHGVCVKKEKCQFLQDSVEYLGHRIDAQGVHTSEKKLKAIVEAPKPRNVQELRSFLGLLQLLCQIHSKFVIHPSPAEQPPESQPTLGLDSCLQSDFSGSQEQACVCSCACSL